MYAAIAFPIMKEIRDNTWGYSRKLHGQVDIERGARRLLARNQAATLEEYISTGVYDEPQNEKNNVDQDKDEE